MERGDDGGGKEDGMETVVGWKEERMEEKMEKWMSMGIRREKVKK